MPVPTAPGPRAFVTINGRETAHRSGTLVRGTEGDDAISLSTTELSYNRLPLIALAGGPGNDTFYFGAPVNAWGGRGDDLFYNPGENFYHPELYPVPRRTGRARCGTFIIWRGYSADQIITDFVQGEGRLALNVGTLHRQQLRRDSGVLWARGVSNDPWERIGRILDAPDLTLADLGFLPEVEWPAG